MQHVGSCLSVAWRETGAEEASEAALILGTVQAVADFGNVDLCLVHHLVERLLVDLELSVLFELLDQVFLRVEPASVTWLEPFDDGPHGLDFFELEVLIVLLVEQQEYVERGLSVRGLVELRLVELLQQLSSLVVIVDRLTALAFKSALQGSVPRVTPRNEAGEACPVIRSSRAISSSVVLVQGSL